MFENSQKPGASLQNKGALVVEPGKTLHFERGASFEQTAGRTTLMPPAAAWRSSTAPA